MSGERAATDGLVIRAFDIGEADRIATILTRRLGVVRASVKGARRIKGSMPACTQLLCYSDFVFFKGRGENQIVDEAAVRTVFLGIHNDLEKLSLAQYFCELEGFLAPRDENAELFLRLILNALSLLEKDRRPAKLVKAAFEMRLLALAGYMPDLVACSICGAYEGEGMFLLPGSGVLECARCHAQKGAADAGEKGIALSAGALAAMRHTVYADFERLFSFTLAPGALDELSHACEQYLLFTLERSFTTLEFYHSL